jgi:hypothetical protein
LGRRNLQGCAEMASPMKGSRRVKGFVGVAVAICLTHLASALPTLPENDGLLLGGTLLKSATVVSTRYLVQLTVPPVSKMNSSLIFG